jgi:ATP-binding cassette, subfamily B, bacterial PglK
MFLAIFEMIALLLFSVLSGITITAISGNSPIGEYRRALEIFRLGNFTPEIQIATLGFLSLLLLIIKTVLSLYITKKTLIMLGNISADLSQKVLESYLDEDIASLEQRSSRVNVYIATYGVDKVTQSLINGWIQVITDCFMLLVIIVSIFLIDSFVALTSLVFFGGLAIFLYRTLKRKSTRNGEMEREVSIQLDQKVTEFLRAYRILLTRDSTSIELEKVRNLRKEIGKINTSKMLIPLLSRYSFELLIVTCTILVVLFALNSRNATELGSSIGVFLLAATRMSPTVVRVQTSMLTIRSGIGTSNISLSYLEKLQKEVVNAIPHKTETRNSHKDFLPTIHVNDLTYGYAGDKLLFQNLNFKVEGGERVALVGKSGVGKTTLVNLIMGSLTPTQGEVLISSLPPRKAFSLWPGKVSYISQHEQPIIGTIRSNLLYGISEDIPDSVLWKSLRLADIDDFVGELPYKLETNLTDMASNLRELTWQEP